MSLKTKDSPSPRDGADGTTAEKGSSKKPSISKQVETPSPVESPPAQDPDLADQSLLDLRQLHAEVEATMALIHQSSVAQAQGHEKVLFKSFQEHLRSIEKDLEHQKQKQPDFDAGHWIEKKKETDIIISLFQERIDRINRTSDALTARLEIISKKSAEESAKAKNAIMAIIKLKKENAEMQQELQRIAVLKGEIPPPPSPPSVTTPIPSSTFSSTIASRGSSAGVSGAGATRDRGKGLPAVRSSIIPAFPNHVYSSAHTSSSSSSSVSPTPSSAPSSASTSGRLLPSAPQARKPPQETEIARLRSQADSLICQIRLEEKKFAVIEREAERKRKRERDDEQLLTVWRSCVKKVLKMREREGARTDSMGMPLSAE